MLLYSKLIYGYLNPGTRRLTEVQDSFLMDGWSQLSWTFLVGSGQTKAGGVSDFFQSTFRSHTFVCCLLRFQSGTGDKYRTENNGNAVRHTASITVL
ncbi:hypothetical protein BDA96_04G293700 [Sorghum bicolor]|uniref:Uncharacterized protein n=1 Tax=Sorghum bicolor TaxID=4558 RepID=A0A921R793_SORBI|nr:hypothetical protein BDA96_04G293700 [Sorghum bicolor]